MDFPALTQRIAVNIKDFDALTEVIRTRYRAGEGFALATVNLDHLVKLTHDKAFSDAYAKQDFVVADGNPVVWLSRIAGQPVSLMPGSDLVVPLARLAAEEGVPVALIGTTDDALDAAGQALQQHAPGLQIADRIAPPFGFDPDSDGAEDVLKQAQSAGARFCFLALGAPKQERLAARGRELTPEMGFASIGASLDFLAGSQTRAPLWVRKLAMEWLWRLLGNPFRLAGRYARCFAILPNLTRDALRQRRHTGRA